MFNVIVAHDSKRGIAKDGKLPWIHNKVDMQRFVEITTKTIDPNKQNAVIMGRKTWDSIDEKFKPLKDRLNWVMTRGTFDNDDVYTCDNFDYSINYLSQLAEVETIFVIGGSEIYELAVSDKRCTRIYVTEFKKDYESDKFFPTLPKWFRQTHSVYEGLLEFKTYDTLLDIYSSEHGYLSLLQHILDNGDKINEERTGVGTISVEGGFMSFPISTMNPNEIDKTKLQYKVPIMTTKTLFVRGVFEELIMFLNGDTNVRELQKKKVGIWDGNTSRKWLDDHNLQNYEVGETGPFYGFQWNFWGADYLGPNSRDVHAKDPKGINQLERCIDLLKTDPYSRRIVLTAWNPTDQPNMCLPPCHLLYCFKVRPPQPNSCGKKVLCCTMIQRSGDMFLGIPFNIASTSMLTIFMSRAAGMLPGTINMTISDAHIYNNHVEQVKEQLTRTPYHFPIIQIDSKITTLKDMRKLKYDNVKITEYNKWPAIKAEMAI
jgi:dihydrofolate reductase/thymidylate synthase